MAGHGDQRRYLVATEPGFFGGAEPFLQRHAQGLLGFRQGRGRRGGDERALAGPAPGQPFVLELPVGLDDCVRVDRQVTGHVLDRRQPVPLPQVTQQQRLPHLVHELQVRRNPRGPVEPEPEHLPSSIITLNYDVGITVEPECDPVKQSAPRSAPSTCSPCTCTSGGRSRPTRSASRTPSASPSVREPAPRSSRPWPTAPPAAGARSPTGSRRTTSPSP